jgi:hypothetical protein
MIHIKNGELKFTKKRKKSSNDNNTSRRKRIDRSSVKESLASILSTLEVQTTTTTTTNEEKPRNPSLALMIETEDEQEKRKNNNDYVDYMLMTQVLMSSNRIHHSLRMNNNITVGGNDYESMNSFIEERYRPTSMDLYNFLKNCRGGTLGSDDCVLWDGERVESTRKVSISTIDGYSADSISTFKNRFSLQNRCRVSPKELSFIWFGKSRQQQQQQHPFSDHHHHHSSSSLLSEKCTTRLTNTCGVSRCINPKHLIRETVSEKIMNRKRKSVGEINDFMFF